MLKPASIFLLILLANIQVFAQDGTNRRVPPPANQQFIKTKPATNTIIDGNAAGTMMADKAYHKVELYFGLTDNGKTISKKKWQQFVNEYITPGFPDGMTIVDAYGQWRNKENSITREKSKLVILICEQDMATAGKVEAIKSKYKELFHQESVLEVDSKTDKVSF